MEVYVGVFVLHTVGNIIYGLTLGKPLYLRKKVCVQYYVLVFRPMAYGGRGSYCTKKVSNCVLYARFQLLEQTR